MIIIHLVRKPLSEANVASNVLKHHTGGLNIDACRLSTGDNLDGGAYTDGAQPRSGELFNALKPGGAGTYVQPSGRWPTNLIFEHHPDCECQGLTKVKGTAFKEGLTRPHGHGEVFRDGKDRDPEGARTLMPQYGDAEGNEVIVDWACAEGCPVADLGNQSGTLTSGRLPADSYRDGGRDNASIFAGAGVFMHHGYEPDTGTAARYYKQVKR